MMTGGRGGDVITSFPISSETLSPRILSLDKDLKGSIFIKVLHDLAWFTVHCSRKLISALVIPCKDI